MADIELRIREFASHLVITDKMLNEAAEKERDALVRIALASGAQWLVVNGMQATAWEQEFERVPELRGWEILQHGEAINDLTLLALVARQEVAIRNQTASLLAVNSLPWWKLMWLKLTGKLLVSGVNA